MKEDRIYLSNKTHSGKNSAVIYSDDIEFEYYDSEDQKMYYYYLEISDLKKIYDHIFGEKE